MAEKQLNTVLVLRNDDTSAWESSERVLKKGELGLEYQEDGTVKIKAGNDSDVFSDLAYVGSDVKPAQVFQVILGENDTDDIGAIEAHLASIANTTGKAIEISVGDIAIIKAGIVGDKSSYTSYVYDGTNWVATDGNYSANNVFFKDNITLAGSYTAVGNVTKSSAAATGTLEAAGKSLAELMQSIFTQELYPAKGDSRNLPSISITVTGDTSGEVGSSYTLPTATVKVDDVGAYTYGPATGIKFEVGKVTLAQGAVATATNKKTNTSVMTANSTFTLDATDTETLYTDSVKTYTFNASGDYTQGAMPVTNLGNDYPDSRIDAGTATASAKSSKRTGYRYMFAGGTTAATIDSSVVRAFSAKKNSRPTSESTALEFTAAGGTTKVICAFPSSYTGTPYFEMFGLAWAENSNFKAKDNIDVADARGTNQDGTLNGKMSYKVYAWELETPLEAETTKFRVYFK